MRRAAAVFSGGPAWWAALVMVVALVALAIDGVVRNRSAHTVRAQYLLLVVLVAVAGSIAGALPFGPTADGMRLSLWLVPVFAIGTASALQRLHNVLTHRWPARMALDAALVIVAALLALSASNGGPNYPLNGSRSAVEFVEQSLKPDDAVLIEAVGSLYPYAAASRLNLIVRPQRKKVAFIPEIRDRRFHTIAFTGTYGNTLLLTTRSDTGGKFDVARAVNGANRVLVFVVALRDLPPAGRRALANVLSRAGFQMQVDARFHDAHVIVWQR